MEGRLGGHSHHGASAEKQCGESESNQTFHGRAPCADGPPTPKGRRAVRISTVTALKSCLFAGLQELPIAGSRAVVFSRRPGKADHRLMRNSYVPHLAARLNPRSICDLGR